MKSEITNQGNLRIFENDTHIVIRRLNSLNPSDISFALKGNKASVDRVQEIIQDEKMRGEREGKTLHAYAVELINKIKDDVTRHRALTYLMDEGSSIEKAIERARQILGE